MPRVVGLDLGRRCGYAIADSAYLRGWEPRSRLEGPRPSNAGLSYDEWRLGDKCDHDTMWARLWEKLSETHASGKIDLLAVETAGAGHFQSADAIWVIVGLAVAARLWAKLHGVTLQMVPNTALKKHAAGSGRAEKPEIIAAAEALGWAPQTANVADALFVLDYALSTWHRSA